jgi:hypothetical protein
VDGNCTAFKHLSITRALDTAHTSV